MPKSEHLITELRESEERFRTICENAPVMIDQFDADGRCKLWNRECEKHLGYTQSEVENSADPLALFYPDEEERNRVLDAIRRADGTFREYRVRSKSGEMRIQMWADFRLPTGTQISVGHDVTEQRAIEAQLRQSQKMDALGHLTGGMAHDFNNLLSVILANAELLDRTVPGSARVKEIIDSASRGAELIRKLLAFSRRETVAMVSLDVAKLITDLAPTCMRLLPETIRIVLHFEPSLPSIRADAGAVEQMLLNLVTNARDAMPADGEIRLCAASHQVNELHARAMEIGAGAYVAVEVKDTGTGMDAATLDRMFEPFFTTKEASGTGLGMPMVYGLMKQHDVAVTVESTPGEGTTVRLIFPAAPGRLRDAHPTGGRDA